VLAQRIIAYREANGPFASVEDLQKVDGVGADTFEKLRELITVAEAP
jgi:competence protein ComEA